MKMTTMSEDEILGRIKMGVNVDIKRSDGKPREFFYFKIVYSMKIEPIIDECHFLKGSFPLKRGFFKKKPFWKRRGAMNEIFFYSLEKAKERVQKISIILMIKLWMEK